MSRADRQRAADKRKARKRVRRRRPVRRPTPDDFSKSAVWKAVLKATIQHPLTTYPVAVSAIAASYMALINVDPTAFKIAFFAAVVGAGSWVYNFFFRGEKLAAAHIQKLRDALHDHDLQTLDELARACDRVGFSDGAREAADLEAAYRLLRDFLDAKKDEGVASVHSFSSLAEDTFKEGVKIIDKALHVYRATSTVDVRKLRRERDEFQRQLAKLVELDAGDHSPQVEAMRTRIDNHETRIRSYDERAATLIDLVAEADRLEGALETAYLQLIDVVDDTPEFGRAHDGVVGQLEQAVAAARRVEERLRDLDRDPASEHDDQYLQAGRSEER